MGRALGAAAVLLGIAAAAATAGTAGPAFSPNAIVEAYGGEGVLERFQAFRTDAEVVARMRGGKGRVRRDLAAPGRLRVEIAYPGTTEVRILDGDLGWRGDAGGARAVEGPPRTAMVYQFLRSAVPWVFVEYAGRFVDRGTRADAGGTLRAVGLPWSPELDLTYWIQEETRRVVRVEGVLRMGNAKSIFATEYGDFRRVEGLLVPFSEENYASGQHTGTTQVLSVSFAPPDLGPFSPPGETRR